MSDRPPLILSHGVIESAESWSDVIRHLGEGFDAVAYDARGRGSAAVRPAPFTYADLAEDVQRLADDRGFDRFLHAGHSMGGRIALEHALRHPDRVAAIAVISARAEAPDAAGRHRLRALAEKARRLGPGEAIDLWTQPGDAHHERVRQISARNSAEGTAVALESLAEMDSLLPRLGELRLPALIVAGDHDAGYVRSAHLMAEAVDGAELRILPGVGHFPNLECPGRLAELLTDFFARHSV